MVDWMTTNMLVRSAGGNWETLTERDAPPTGGIAELFGEDLGPLTGSPEPLFVVAAAPTLPTGTPDALCVTRNGDVCIVMLALDEAKAQRAMGDLLAHAGALHGMQASEFSALCNRVTPVDDGVPGFVSVRSRGTGFHRKSFEATLAGALAQGRFQLTAFVTSAPESLTNSMRFLNASGAAQISLHEVVTFTGGDMTAVRVNPINVGDVQTSPVDATPMANSAMLVAVTERTQGEVVGAMMAQLEASCRNVFDELDFEGDMNSCSMHGIVRSKGQSASFLTAASDGTVELKFDSIAGMEGSSTARAELVHGLARLLGADLGDARKVKNMTLNIAEHLNDATLVECLTEVLNDAFQVLRPETAPAAAVA
jgi:hypothetical protein